METKQQFFRRAKIRNLPQGEKERRWQQHLRSRQDQTKMALRDRRRTSRRGFTPNTTLVNKAGVAELHLSPCAQHYMMALLMPFAAKQVACVPDMHAIPSKKIRVKTRGTFSTGLDGNGFIVCCNWCNSTGADQVGYSTATLASSSSILNISPPAVGVSKANQPKIPYTIADFAATTSTPGVQARTVGVGLRIRYIGPELSRSGQITGVRHPDNETLVGLSYNDIKSYSTAKTYLNGRQWIYVMFRPVKPDEYHFSTQNATASDGTNYKWEMGFVITGTTDTNGAPGPASFEWETVRYVEYIGNIDNITHSHVDLQGISHVRNALPTKSTTDTPHKTFGHAIKAVEDSIGESIPAAAAGALSYKSLTAPAAEAGEGFFASLASKARSVLAGAGEVMEGIIPEGAELLAPLLI